MSQHDRTLKYPRIKRGVSLTNLGANHYLGLPTRGILISEALQVQMVRTMDGRHTLQEISSGLMCDLMELSSFTAHLLAAGFLDFLNTPFEPISADLSQQLRAHRESTEQTLLSHRVGVHDGGNSELNARAHVTILISGENRLARNLLVSLHASGFTQSRLISRAHLPSQIVGGDVCGIAVRTSDIGKDRSDFTKELIRNSQISRNVEGAKPKPDLIISTIPIEWDYVQRWMSEGSTHLHINPMIGPDVEVGPLVVPGQTPCLRCVTLIKRENGTVVDQEFVRSELPSASIAFLSGLITLAVGELFATGLSPLYAASFWYNLLDPMRPPERRHWSFHPKCGCKH